MPASTVTCTPTPPSSPPNAQRLLHSAYRRTGLLAVPARPPYRRGPPDAVRHSRDASDSRGAATSAVKQYVTLLIPSELSILEEATTAALEQLGRSAVSDPHGFADAAISEDLMDSLLDQIYDTAEQNGAEEQQSPLVLSADLRDVARALLTAASSALSERSMEAQEDGRLPEAALLLAQATLAREVELRLTLAAIEQDA